MTGTSARQFEGDIKERLKRGMEKEFARGFPLQDLIRAGQIAGGISGCIKSIISLEDANRWHAQQVFPQAPHSHVHSLVPTGTHAHEIDYSVVNPALRWTTSYVGGFAAQWECPYCGANHDLAVKLCDCCGARRRREYVL